MGSVNQFVSQLLGELMTEIQIFKILFKDFRNNFFFPPSKGFSWDIFPPLRVQQYYCFCLTVVLKRRVSPLAASMGWVWVYVI